MSNKETEEKEFSLTGLLGEALGASTKGIISVAGYVYDELKEQPSRFSEGFNKGYDHGIFDEDTDKEETDKSRKPRFTTSK